MVEVLSSAGEGAGRPGLIPGSKDVFVNDGRTTPTPESESANYLSRNSSFPSTTSQAQSAPNEPTAGTPLYVPKAEVGMGPLSGEEQLKASLQAKDRIFLLVLAKEIEAFIAKVAAGEEPNIIPSIPLATNSSSVLASMSASFAVASHISSTFQRMLVYKLAEWYGLKAVHTTEVAMLVGVLGTLEPRSATLRLSDLAPRADTPPQQFRIMQRSQAPSSTASSDANGLSRTSSVAPDDAALEASSSRVKTLQEREAAYNKARERIYGGTDTGDDPQDQMGTIRQKRSVQDQLDDDFETAPRPGIVTNDPMFQQPIYPSLYDPPRNPAAGPSGQQYNPYQPDPTYGGVPQQMPMYMGDYQQAPYPAQYSQGMPQYSMPPYVSAQQYPHTQQQAVYPAQWGQVQPQYGRQMPPNPSMQQAWGPPQQGPTMPNQPMPMIPQGMQYPGVYGYPPQQQQQQQNCPPLMQPMPMRPAVHPHSSASSSISSRSYQSYHDGSRPHSRGSTTSNMSATSSVRFGAIYPANQAPGYRQKGLKGPGVNGLAGLTLPGEARRNNTRPHSPSSATTASSRSSRHAGSINLVAPSQHPLPQRPDWAANNVPYQISSAGSTSSASNTEFPPLARNGTGLQAEPMQVERVKTRSNGSVWTSPGTGGTNTGSQSSPAASTNVSELSPTSPRSRMMRTPGPLVPSPKTPGVAPPPAIPQTRTNGGDETEGDDFPRRATALNSSQTLFDPSDSMPSTATRPDAPKADIDENAMTPDEVIEAKLAAISLREGVTIGPPPAKQNGPAPSYARIVKRD